MKELENASAKYHIDKLEALKLIVQQEMEKVFGNELDFIDNMARKVYTDNYYHSLFEVQKGFNIGFNIGQLDTNQLDIVIAKPWATDGKNFSDRVWQRKSKMVKELHQELTRTLLKGKAPDEAIKHMSQYVDKSIKNAKYAAGRLVMTEQAYFHSESQKTAFKDLNVEEFEIVATLDSHTSEICREMDGKHFPMKEYEPGATAPPFHCYCRSVTAPYFDDEFTIGEKRAARGKDGKTIKIDGSITYKKWRKWVDSDYKENAFEVLTNKEKQAIIQYKSSESYKINEKLYNKSKLSKKEKEFIYNLDKALEKMPTYQGNLVRDLYFYDKDSMNEFLNAHKVGNTVNYRAYTSTTKANSYNDMANVRIYINNSKMGKDISSIGLDEEEVLYPRNSEFLVNSIRKSSNLVEIILKELSND